MYCNPQRGSAQPQYCGEKVFFSHFDGVSHRLHLFQETMTEPSVFAQDVHKLKDADELKQAYVGLKDTNRYTAIQLFPLSILKSGLLLKMYFSFKSLQDDLWESIVRLYVLPDPPAQWFQRRKSVISWVGWGNREEVAHALWLEACMTSLPAVKNQAMT